MIQNDYVRQKYLKIKQAFLKNQNFHLQIKKKVLSDLTVYEFI